MDKIIEKYDYVNATEKTEEALTEKLNDLEINATGEGDLQNLKKILDTFKKKVCCENYVKKQNRHTPGNWMSKVTMMRINELVDAYIESETIRLSDCQECLFELLLSLLRTGPGTSLGEVIDELITDTAEMNDVIENVKVENLKRLVSALKEHKFIKEDLENKEYASATGDFLQSFLQRFISKERSKEPEVWSAMLDLFTFYLVHTGDVPNFLHLPLQYCGNRIKSEGYNGNPYKGFPDNEILRQHVQKISAFILSPGFPRGRQLKITTEYIEMLCDNDNNQLEAVMPELISLYNSVKKSKKASELDPIIKPLGTLNEGNTRKENKKLIESFSLWAPNFLKTIDSLKNDLEKLESIARNMLWDLQEQYKPSKGDEKYWFKILKKLLSIPSEYFVNKAKQILKEQQYKKLWQWKENVHEAKEMIQIIGKLDLPGEDKDWHEACGSYLSALIELMRIQKVDDMIMPEIGALALTELEKMSTLILRCTYEYVGEISFEKVPQCIPELAKRFASVVTNPEFSYLDVNAKRCGRYLFDYILGAYQTGDEIPESVNKSIMKILDFCLEDERELFNTEDGDGTIFEYFLRQSTTDFIQKHCSSGTAEVCLPVVDNLLKLRNHDEEEIREIPVTALGLVSQSPKFGVKYLRPLLEWYMEEPSYNMMRMISEIAEAPGGNTDLSPLYKVFDKFVEISKDYKDTYYYQMIVFLKLSSDKPEVFTSEIVDIIMKHFYTDDNHRSTVLMILSSLAKINPELVEKYMDFLLADETHNAFEQPSINTILLEILRTFPKYKDRIYKSLIDLLIKSSKDTSLSGLSLSHTTVSSLRDLCGRYGPDLFTQHKDLIIKFRDQEKNHDLKNHYTFLIDQLEGRTLETLDVNIKETQDGVEQLDTRLTGTEVAVDTLTTRVDEHDENIQELGEGLDTVTQRVDFAEKDIEETKVKVEEIDNKTMTNAPRWSRDLTKLMNLKDEHDWRLLAQRLGYSNDDIRAWATQHDPCMAVLSEWYATHKTREATYAVLTALQEMNRMDGAAIVENAMKAVEDVVEGEEVDYPSPPPVFLSYQWGHQNEVKLIRNHLQMAGYECWMDIGQMGGGDKLFEKIDNGIRGAKVVICCVSEKYAASPNCNREVNLSVSLGKPMIPLLMEKMSWPPKGSMGPIFSEYLFVRFFQRSGEETDDDRIWPVAKFQEMLMQLNCYGVKPDESLIEVMYKDWWIPVQEVIIIDKTKNKKENLPQVKKKEELDEEKKSPEVFISYQWGKQKQIMALYQRLTGMGFSVWMDIYQMGGGDSLYEKIDSGVRGCKVILTCITPKYSLSANCRREVSLADALKKPMIPLLLEKMDWPPSGPMSMVFTQLLFINCYRDEEVQIKWIGPKFDELLQKIGEHIPMIMPAESNNKENNQHRQKNTPSKKQTVVPNSERPVSVKTAHRPLSVKSGQRSANQTIESGAKNQKGVHGPVTQESNHKPVSQRNKAGGPQPTGNKPQPTHQTKPVDGDHIQTTMSEHNQQQRVNEREDSSSKQLEEKEEKTVQENKKSSSCILL